jgi:hypothetical protein
MSREEKMAKPLRHPTPSSSVARLFDRGAAERAIAKPEATEEKPSTREEVVALPRLAAGERANIKREFVLSQSTEETFSDLVSLYQRATRTRLTASHVARAMLKGVAHCMDSLEREAGHIGRLKLPSNAKGRENERERFEEHIAMAFVAGIRAAPSFNRE